MAQDSVPTTATPANEWPGAFGLFKPSLRTVAFNIWPFLLTAVLASIVQGLPDFGALFTDSKPLYAVLAVIGYGTSIVLSLATTLVILNAMRSKKISFSEAVTGSLPFALRAIGVILLSILIAVASLALLVIPFFFIFPRISLAMYYVLDQNTGVVEAIKASWKQTSGQLGKLYGIIGVNILMILPVFTLVGIPLSIFLLVAYSAASVLLYRYLVSGNLEVPAEAVK